MNYAANMALFRDTSGWWLRWNGVLAGFDFVLRMNRVAGRTNNSWCDKNQQVLLLIGSAGDLNPPRRMVCPSQALSAMAVCLKAKKGFWHRNE